MNRIKKTFEKLAKAKKKALIPYITAGDPDLQSTVAILQTLAANGSDILELGMAFSDPVADGIVIQAAHLRALKSGLTLKRYFDVVSEFRKTDNTTPIVFMGYLNPIETMGYDVFAEKAAKSGVDGVLIVDLPPDEGEALFSLLKQKSISPIFLIAPTTSEERMKMILKNAEGYIYAVALKGVTGSTDLDVAAVAKQVEHIKQHTQLPVAVGFGIRDGKSAGAVAEFADAVIVGSALVSIIEKHADDQKVLSQQMADLTQSLRNGIDALT